MEKNILVVPDVHGRAFWRRVLDSDLPVVFLGDYVDPYKYEGIDYNQALKEFSDIIEFAKERPDDVTLPIGNHEIFLNLFVRNHYIYYFCIKIINLVKNLLCENINLMKTFLKV